MSYAIEALPITTFLDDNSLKLPRFQRKATWKSKQNFELAISVFQDYPVGVVIINKEKDQSWLLDGRQRRSALKAMRENPIELYEWARSYVNFRATEDPLEIKRKYWAKVEMYLQTDPTSATIEYDERSADEGLDYVGLIDQESDDNSFDSARQREGLNTLLDLILMIHQRKRGISRCERLFDFTGYFQMLSYAPKRAQGKVQPKELRKWINELSEATKSNGGLTQDAFIDYYLDRAPIKSQKDECDFVSDVQKNWQEIEESIRTISKSERIFADARIGVIMLTKASPLDAQNIFSRINAGGTQLTAEELLSAKPYWNKLVGQVDSETEAYITKLYENMDLPRPEYFVRWDVAATLLSRIDKTHLIFTNYPNDEISMTKVSLGFRLLGSIYSGGMSAKRVIELELNDQIDWIGDIDHLVFELNLVCEVILGTSTFKFLNSWQKPIVELVGNAIALEFLVIMLKDWRKHGKPTASCGSGELHAVQRDALVLFDRLVFEYATKQWRGSGDSRMAKDIKDWEARLSPVSQDDWLSFIRGASAGMYNGQQTSVSSLRPILYYYYVLRGECPGLTANVTFDIDHIIPQERFASNLSVDQNMKDSLCNLALLPTKDNISKKNKLLKDITDPWLISQVSLYTGIDQSMFAEYSSATKVMELAESRIEYYLDAFGDTRADAVSL